MGHLTAQLRDALQRGAEHLKAAIDCGVTAACLWLEDHQAGASAIGKAPAPIPNDEIELTAQDQANIMATLRSDRNQLQEQTVSVYKRDKRGERVKDNEPGTWCYDFTEEGVRHRKSLPKVRTKKEARAVERHAQHKVQTGAADQETIRELKSELAAVNTKLKAINSNKAGDKEIKFEDFFNTEYLPEKLVFNPETYSQYEHMAKIFCAYFKGKMMHEITPGDIRAFRQERAESKTRTGGARSIATLNRERAQLSGVFQLAVDNGYIVNNPARNVKAIPVDNARERVLEPEEEAKLFEALTGDLAKFKPVALLALHTGLRLSEAVKLMWEQVDLSDGEYGRKLAIKSKGRGRKKKKRIIPLNNAAFQLLQGLRAECAGKGRVFTGRGMSPTNVCHRFSVICDEIGLPDVTFHTLRHSYATRWAESGDAGPEQVRRMMGHSNLTTTQRYFHVGEKSLREAVNKQDSREAERTSSGPIPDAIEDTNPE